MMGPAYPSFLSTKAEKQWQHLGAQRRAGVATPLFSLYSDQSIGIGEIPDLKLLIDWCSLTGMSLLQLLPMNDVGFEFRPYDAASSFALEPAYLSLPKLVGVSLEPFQKDLEALKKAFPAGRGRVCYDVKKAKLDLLWKIFQKNSSTQAPAFEEYLKKNNYWIRAYALFKVLKEIHQNHYWRDWPAPYRDRDPETLEAFEKANQQRITFYAWLQWQLYEQLCEVKGYAHSKDVFLVGDLPFLVSSDSADVWFYPYYFKQDWVAGAPPDFYFFKGQRWGMPPYDWPEIERHSFDYLNQRLKVAENFYDLFRIDHAVGLFRVWTIAQEEPFEHQGLHGVFDPQDESQWEKHGRYLLSLILEKTKMLPCAEDLGIVPECSYKVLKEFGIPGVQMQRWTKDWGVTYDFLSGADYRINSVSMVSGHDTSGLQAWWEFEAGTVDGALFKRKCEEGGLDFEKIQGQLFDLEKSHYGRLRWQENISEETLKKVLCSQDAQQELLDLYLGSYREKEKFWQFLGLSQEAFKEKATPDFIRGALKKASEAASVFSIQLLGDWLSLAGLAEDSWNQRINFPGTVSPENWSHVYPYSLEEILKLEINSEIKKINDEAKRE